MEDLSGTQSFLMTKQVLAMCGYRRKVYFMRLEREARSERSERVRGMRGME